MKAGLCHKELSEWEPDRLIKVIIKQTYIESAKAERERIANLLAPRGCQCCPYPKALCNTTDNCFDCWIRYLNDTPGEDANVLD